MTTRNDTATAIVPARLEEAGRQQQDEAALPGVPERRGHHHQSDYRKHCRGGHAAEIDIAGVRVLADSAGVQRLRPCIGTPRENCPGGALIASNSSRESTAVRS